jgi:hypothetical protein
MLMPPSEIFVVKCNPPPMQNMTGLSVLAIFLHTNAVMLEKSPETLKGLKQGLNGIIS